jgi:hypothetical protein
MKICPHCKEEFNIIAKSFGAHVTNCKLNPKRKEIIDKIKKAKTHERRIYKFNCIKCNSYYEVFLRENDFKKGKYKKYCSRKCANSHFVSEETKNKISKSLMGKEPINKSIKKNYFCKKCNKKLYKKNKSYLCKNCTYKSEEFKNLLSFKLKGNNLGDKNGMYGKSPKHTRKIKVYSNKNIGEKEFIVRSSYEKIFIEKLNEDKSVDFFKYEPKEYRTEYISEGLKRTYQPDFLINGKEIIEIKNKWNITLEETKIKERAFRNKFPLIPYKIISR